MQAFIVILLGLGFTAGIMYSTVEHDNITAIKSLQKDENVVQIDSDIDLIDESDCDSIFPIL